MAGITLQAMSDSSSATAPSPLLSRRVLRDGVYDILLDLLLSGTVEPGSTLGIDSLSRQLQVSPTPIREALAQLEHTGLVQRAALKGYRVAPPLSPEQMKELFEARIILETNAVALASRDLEGLLPDLRRAHGNHVAVARENSAGRKGERDLEGFKHYFDADWAFHQTILDHCGNRFISQMTQSTSTHAHRMRQTVSRGVSDSDEAVQEHAAVLEAFEKHDVPAAEEAMRQHIQNVRARALAAAQ